MTADLETRVRMLEVQAQEQTSLTKERFAQGNVAFAAIRESIGQLTSVVQPKPVSLGRVIGLTVTIVALAGGALWGLSTKLSDRPTIEQVRSVVSEHSANGHPTLSNDIAGMKQEQAVQGVKLEGIEKSVAEIKAAIATMPRKPR